ncbi:MAG: bifunctional (p)ppGpp synthetase/guanosine-3',5'-bis(diphosphate) 3'-pyrophosphohydrolase, partial [Prevotella bivia]|nr:bifunctional (p)ppGpp synthetase/guanosine-3',5'-bis(diphosphate) 3'-pyrophosphohydrolase [Prevotella bivia]
MGDKFTFTEEEKLKAAATLKDLRIILGEDFPEKEMIKLQEHIDNSIYNNEVKRNIFNLNPILCALQTALIATRDIGLKSDSLLAILLYNSVQDGFALLEDIQKQYGEGVAKIIHGLNKIQRLYTKNPIIESENFRNLLLSFAEDMRVILIMIADRVNLMRQIRDTKNLEAQRKVAEEASYLYAPLAHKLGLYQLKRELEDLSLKYLEHDAYYHIKEKLNATKQARDAYIKSFIEPVQTTLQNAGLRFHIKGRTKSIHSIWQKMKKQKCKFEGIYDLFAIRIILDAPLEREKMQCWQAYSIVTDMYQPNPKRLRDWLSVPK